MKRNVSERYTGCQMLEKEEKKPLSLLSPKKRTAWASLLFTFVTIVFFLFFGHDAFVFAWPSVFVILLFRGIIDVLGEIGEKTVSICVLFVYYYAILWPIFRIRKDKWVGYMTTIGILLLSAIIYVFIIKKIDFA